ncbi:hypothetical protein [Lentiprolixibacter aurantiacus]|uniref:STAS/SEC14 domain-containing protein n=1 Tax=Lentiprolixibacter aurantiacus TaxID=2993939 RepID=A0AAE3ML82_9FLAO|nr:hypothetical protein [Lentiprolixibacter aurantiacus]MCX2719493.1 hypothetical protein [Lentiprolixibacter aurantiacus]
MNSTYAFKNKVQFLVMSIDGIYDYWDFIKYPKVILRKCQSAQVYRVLVDLIPVSYTELPTIELFFLGEIIAEVLRDKVKLALVWKGKEEEQFLEQVATNRAANMRIFDSVKIAEYWLLHDHEVQTSNPHKV